MPYHPYIDDVGRQLLVLLLTLIGLVQHVSFFRSCRSTAMVSFATV